MRVRRYDRKGHTSQTYDADVVLSGDSCHIYMQPTKGASAPVRLVFSVNDLREIVERANRPSI